VDGTESRNRCEWHAQPDVISDTLPARFSGATIIGVDRASSAVDRLTVGAKLKRDYRRSFGVDIAADLTEEPLVKYLGEQLRVKS